MKKVLPVLLVSIMLVILPSISGAEYRDYRLTAGDTASALACACYPIDAHNTIVRSISLFDEKQPWRMAWYRDGRLYRELTGTEELIGAVPLIGEGGSLRMLFSVMTGSGDGQMSPDAGGKKTCLGQWTENGLEEGVLLTSWRGPYFRNSLIICCEEACCRLVYRGKETVLRGDVCDSIREGLTDVCPLGEDVYLLGQYAGRDRHTDKDQYRLICLDHGAEKYRINVSGSLWFLLPDGQGGFFCPEDHSRGDYTPQKLLHYDPDGRLDREMSLQGDRVVAEISEAFFDERTGLLTFYGSAVASSRQLYSVFSMTVGAQMDVLDLDVRSIDPVYGDYSPRIYLAPDGTAYVFIADLHEKPMLQPVLIPFSKLEPGGDDPGLSLR